MFKEVIAPANTVALLAMLILTSCARDSVNITDFGVLPDSGENATPAVQRALKACKEQGINILKFPKGVYHFYEGHASRVEYSYSNSNNHQPLRSIPFWLDSLSDFTLDGDGSQFIFHGWQTAFAIDRSSNVQLRNFSMDWERPFVSQGRIENATSNYVDINIDKERFPYFIKDERLWFKGEGWEYPAGLYVFLDDSLNIAEGTLDEPMGEYFFDNKTEMAGENLVRVYGRPDITPVRGTRLVLRHGKGDNLGIFIYRSKNVELINVRLHHAPGKAILAQRSENILLDSTHVTPNSALDRWVSSYADAFHFSGCKGNIRVTHCDNRGQMDDWLNVHGTYTTVDSLIDDHTVMGRFRHWESTNMLIAERGDTVNILLKETGELQETLVVDKFELLGEDLFIMTFGSTMKKKPSHGAILENITWTPSLFFSENRILKTHRARGLLITTPRRVEVTKNYFSTAGTAILIEADIDRWFESGAVRDMIISHNVFDRCYTSGYVGGKTYSKNVGYFWGDGAVLSVTPSFHPTDEQTPGFHANIRIENNRIISIDAPLVYARAVDNLQFGNNDIEYTKKLIDFPQLVLDGCRKVKLFENTFRERDMVDVVIDHMSLSDIAGGTQLNIYKAGQ